MTSALDPTPAPAPTSSTLGTYLHAIMALALITALAILLGLGKVTEAVAVPVMTLAAGYSGGIASQQTT